MKRFTKSHELGVFMISLVLVVTGIRGDEENRVDAEQDPFEKATLADDGGAHSILFGSCLAASRTLEVKLYSIELPPATPRDGRIVVEEFIRYVPDSWQLRVLPVWETATSNPPVAKIVDCAAAAKSGGNAMFKYSGGSDCKVSNQSYDLKYTPACDAEEHEAVFILDSVVVGCPLPGILMKPDPVKKENVCLTVYTEPMSHMAARPFCEGKSAIIYGGPDPSNSFNDMVKILKDQKVESSNFIVETIHTANLPWQWKSTDPIDTALMVGAPPASTDYSAYMKGAADFKLDFAPWATFKGGFMCKKTFG